MPPPPDSDGGVAGTVDFMTSIEAGVTEMVTTVTPAIAPFGWTLLGLFGVYALLQALLQTTLRSLAGWHYPPLAHVVAYIAVLFRIAIAATMMSFYSTSIPGLGINFHQIFPSLSRAMAGLVTTAMLKEVLAYFADAVHYLPPVGILAVMPALVTVGLLGLIALSEVAMTVITAGGYCIVGVLTSVGMLMIPFYVLPGHDKKFWNWFDNMLVYSMYTFVAALFISVFGHAYIDFFTDLHGFSLGAWVVSLGRLAVITVAFLWLMFKVPDIAHMIFGGVGGIAQGFANAVQGLAVRAIAAAL